MLYTVLAAAAAAAQARSVPPLKKGSTELNPVFCKVAVLLP